MALLEFAETAGVSLPYGCRQGQCGTCATRLLQGRVTMQAEVGKFRAPYVWTLDTFFGLADARLVSPPVETGFGLY
jgi:ferredoxin